MSLYFLLGCLLISTTLGQHDDHPFCCYWAGNDECNTNPLFMRPLCQKSCGTPGCTIETAKECEVKLNVRECPFPLNARFPWPQMAVLSLINKRGDATGFSSDLNKLGYKESNLPDAPEPQTQPPPTPIDDLPPPKVTRPVWPVTEEPPPPPPPQTQPPLPPNDDLPPIQQPPEIHNPADLYKPPQTNGYGQRLASLSAEEQDLLVQCQQIVTKVIFQ